jgi:hypothetical protein
MVFRGLCSAFWDVPRCGCSFPISDQRTGPCSGPFLDIYFRLLAVCDLESHRQHPKPGHTLINRPCAGLGQFLNERADEGVIWTTTIPTISRCRSHFDRLTSHWLFKNFSMVFFKVLNGLLKSSTGPFWTVLISNDLFAGRDLPGTNAYLRVPPATSALLRRSLFLLGQPQLVAIVVQTNESSSNPRLQHERPQILLFHHEIVTCDMAPSVSEPDAAGLIVCLPVSFDFAVKAGGGRR